MSGWQPIATAPDDDTPILACVAGDEYLPTIVARLPAPAMTTNPLAGPADWRMVGTNLAILVAPTHWMPLPEPPEVA